jgi:hypothetical protein
MSVNALHSPDGFVKPNYFAPRRVLLCLLPLLVLMLWIVALSVATAGGTATATSPARMAVNVPATAKNPGVVMLEVSIGVMRKASNGHLGAVVRVRPPGGGDAIEVGRVSITGDGQSYQFNVSRAVGAASAGPAEVEVSLIDRGGGPPPADAALSIGRAQFVTR